MIGVVLALISAATSGLSVVLVRKHSASSNAFNMSLVITLVGMAVLCPLAFAFTSLGNLNVEGVVLFAVSGVFSPGLVRLLYYEGMKKLGASGNSAVFAVYPLYSALFAVVLLGELLSLGNWVGIFLVVVGVVLIDLTVHNNGSSVEEGGAGRKGLVFPIVGGVVLGVSSIIRKAALVVCDAPVFGVAVAYAFSLVVYLLFLAFSAQSRRELEFKQSFQWFWVAGVGQAVTWILAFYALSFEQVSITAPLLSVEPLFVVVFAYFYLKKVEKVSLQLLASVAITILGVALVTL